MQIDPIPGYNLYLSIDTDLQIAAYNTLADILEQRRQQPDRLGKPVEAEQGAVVVMKPDTGEILAMVNIPTFDNNRFATEIPLDYYLGLARNEYLPMFNHAIGGQYPPGSVYKLIMAVAALQEGVISPLRESTTRRIEIPNRFAPNDPGRVQPFICWIYNQLGAVNQHGGVNMYTGHCPCHVYFYKVNGGFDQDGEFIEGLGVDRLNEYADQFLGLGRVQGIELPLEAPGINPSRSWKRLNRATGRQATTITWPSDRDLSPLPPYKWPKWSPSSSTVVSCTAPPSFIT